MTNREKYILQRNEYDMLCGLQAAFGSGLCQCVIEALTAKEQPCGDYRVMNFEVCCQCIQQWLNEEAK